MERGANRYMAGDESIYGGAGYILFVEALQQSRVKQQKPNKTRRPRAPSPFYSSDRSLFAA